MGLSEDARKELKEAIRIVREDRFETHARGVLSSYAPKNPPQDPPKDPNNPDAPPPKDPPTDPPKTRRSGYWGELLSE
jgi:hypothetical protein